MINYLRLLINNSISLIIFVVISLLPLGKVFPQDKTQGFQEIVKKFDIPAIQLNYLKNGQDHFYNYGVKNVDSKDSIDQNTVFQAASLTKVIATYAFLRLMDKGLIELDKPLWEYYHYPRLTNNPNKDKITARMVLTHRTGLLNWEGDVGTASWKKTPLTSQFEPGTDYMYSGEGFYFLQETMEQITGKSFQQLVEEEVLIPLGMKNSAIVWNDELIHNAAYGHYENGKARKMGMYRNSNAAYTLYTTAKDYSIFLNSYVINGTGLKKKTHKFALSRLSEAKKASHKSPDDQHVPCALGMRMQINELGTAYWHTGSNPGFRCFFLAYPKTKEILVAFSNSDNGFVTIPHLLALFLNNNQTFWMYKWRQGELD